MDVTANFYRYPAGAASDGIEIPAGQHTWRVRVADRAGNVASNMATFTATGTTNTDAPVISNVSIGGGGVTILPAASGGRFNTGRPSVVRSARSETGAQR